MCYFHTFPDMQFFFVFNLQRLVFRIFNMRTGWIVAKHDLIHVWHNKPLKKHRTVWRGPTNHYQDFAFFTQQIPGAFIFLGCLAEDHPIQMGGFERKLYIYIYMSCDWAHPLDEGWWSHDGHVRVFFRHYPLVLTNIANWTITMLLRTVNHLFLWAIYTMAMLNNQMVIPYKYLVWGPLLTFHKRCTVLPYC